MFGELNPLLTGIVVFVVLAASIVIVVSLGLSHRGIHLPHLVLHERKVGAALPTGAEAALWSIVEAVPDPRNHLALTRDLSGEVHITSADREAAAALFAERPRTERIAPAEPAPAPPGDEAPFVTRYQDDDAATEPESDQDRLVRTSEFFFAGEPHLNRF